MSIFPCDVCHKRPRGPLDAAYFALLRGQSRYSRRVRVCPDDRDGLLQNQAAFLSRVEADDLDALAAVCNSCGDAFDPDTGSDAVFATVYQRGTDREDYFGRVCRPCGDDILEGLKMTLQ